MESVASMLIIMKFYVIEGDNGTEKDTLAAKFQNDGFEILTYDKKIKQMEQIAKKKVGEDKVLNFLHTIKHVEI